MELNEINNALSVLENLRRARICISKERFDLTAKVAFGVTAPKRLDVLYGYFNTLEGMNMEYMRKHGKQDEVLLSVAIANAALLERDTLLYKDIPHLEGCNDDFGGDDDRRRYFYTVGDDPKEVLSADVNLADAHNLIMLAELVKRDDVRLVACVPQKGELERGMERVPYYVGDIVFVYGDPSDRVFYSWYDTDAGVYLATRHDGWRKLLYVPGRGYLDRDGRPEYENDSHFSDYKIDHSGNGWRFVGNIYADDSVLRDRAAGTIENENA